jgi:heterodisulfide reductase subunit B
MEDLIESLGGKVVDSPLKIECCGSYHTVGNVGAVAERTRLIVEDSRKRGADMIVVGCPLCFFNLDFRQKDVERIDMGFKGLPVFYFTQLLALALDLDVNVCEFDEHFVDPRTLLMEKELISSVEENE